MVVPKGQFISTVANNGQSKAANYNSVNKRYGENNGGAVLRLTISSRFATTSLTWNIPSGSSSSVWVDSKQNTLRLGTSIMAERSSRSWPSGRECVAKQVGQRDMSRQIPYKATLARPLCRNNQSTPICDDISLDERQQNSTRTKKPTAPTKGSSVR